MKRLLLDTCTFLWWLADDARLGAGARALIAEANNQIFVSAATAWEISIKKSLGKLEAPDDLDDMVEKEGFEKLSITFFHGERTGALPQLHQDPFDRILVAQSADEAIPKYGVKTVDALK